MKRRTIGLMTVAFLLAVLLFTLGDESSLQKGIVRLGVPEFSTYTIYDTSLMASNIHKSIIASDGSLVHSRSAGAVTVIQPSTYLTDSLLYLPSVMVPGYTYLPAVYNTGDRSEEILIPAGTFLMGCDGSDPDRLCRPSNQYPHLVYLDAYYIDKNEVTNARYQVCVEAEGCTEPSQRNSATRDPYYGNSTYANYPVVWVNWYQAAEFCAWAGKRLPTEAEWEKAARGSEDSRWYPWGDEIPDATMANFGEIVGDTTPVGAYSEGASVYGVMDMAGNTWEWVNDWFGFYYYPASPGENPPGPSTGEHRGRRGGSWGESAYRARSDYRSINLPENAANSNGFRCVRSAFASQ